MATTYPPFPRNRRQTSGVAGKPGQPLISPQGPPMDTSDPVATRTAPRSGCPITPSSEEAVEDGGW
jgi:hypothetical protein